MLECFKTEVPQLNNLDASSSNTSSGSATHKPNKESLEFAIVALIRAFTGHAEAFRTYLQAGASADRSSAGEERRDDEMVVVGQQEILFD